MSEPTSPIGHEDCRTPGKRRAAGALRKLHLRGLVGGYPSPNYSSRGGTKVTGVVIHTAEGPTDANSLGAYFAQTKVQASSHVGIDAAKTVPYVDYQFEAWTLRNGNPWTDNAEMCGFAAWTRDQWLAHLDMVKRAAVWVAERCHARGVPPVRLTPADIRAGRRSGYFAHWDYTQATGDGTHWDVGTGFPWDVFGQLVQAAYGGNPTPTLDQEDDMKLIRNKDTGGVYVAGEFSMSLIPTPAIWDDYKAAGYTTTEVSGPQFQQLEADAAARRAALLTDVHRNVLCRTPDDRPGRPWPVDSIYGTDDKTGAILAKEDPQVLAQELAKLLPAGGGSVSEADLEAALRSVLGSLDNA